jgi:hypothetical protein
MTTLIIGNLFRDLTKKRSVVTLTWEDDPEKHLGLVVPFDCTFENLKAETERALCERIRVGSYTERLGHCLKATRFPVPLRAFAALGEGQEPEGPSS